MGKFGDRKNLSPSEGPEKDSRGLDVSKIWEIIDRTLFSGQRKIWGGGDLGGAGL